MNCLSFLIKKGIVFQNYNSICFWVTDFLHQIFPEHLFFLFFFVFFFGRWRLLVKSFCRTLKGRWEICFHMQVIKQSSETAGKCHGSFLFLRIVFLLVLRQPEAVFSLVFSQTNLMSVLGHGFVLFLIVCQAQKKW